MKLTLSTPLTPFADALGNAALQSSIEALGESSHAGALGSLEHLIYSICQQHPKALAVVNEYVERHTPKLIAEHGKAVIEEWFKPLDAVVNPPADTATMTAAEHEELRALREQLEEKQRNYWEFYRQVRAICHGQQTTTQTAADADATAAAAAPEAPAPQPVQTAPCGAPTANAEAVLSTPPAPAEGRADATAAPELPASLLHPESAALTAPAQETAPHVTPSPASSARPNTTDAGGAHASTQPSQPTTAAS